MKKCNWCIQAGQTLFFILGAMVVLALLAVTLLTITRVQQVTTQPYINQVRSRLLAQRGIEITLERFKTQPDECFIKEVLPPWFYWGEDINQNNLLDPDEDQNKNGWLDIVSCPMGLVLRPSYKKGEVTLKRVQDGSAWGLSQGQKIGYSGKVSRPGGEVDFYTLKITDCSSQIYINGQGLGTRQLLNNLGTILGLNDRLGDKIITYRDTRRGGTFNVKEELIPCVGKKTYTVLEPYLTVYAQPNHKVIKPCPLYERAAHLKIGMDIVRASELNPGPLELESRASININTAPKPVLMAVIRKLEGFYLAEAGVTNPSFSGGIETPPNVFGYSEKPVLRNGRLASTKILPAMVEPIANEIIRARTARPFLTWTRFNDFCGRLMKKGLLGPTNNPVNEEKARARRDLLKANANPNTLLNDFNPNKLTYQMIDKSDLTTYTTEFCFQPQGYFEIASLGLVTSIPVSTTGKEPTLSEVNLIGAYKIRCVVKLFDSYYETTQQDFARGSVSSSRKSDFTHNKRSLQTYPEPDIDKYPQGSVADGQIMLATLENHSRNKQANDLLTFQVHFRNSFRADYAGGNHEFVAETEAMDKAGLPTGESLGRPNTLSLFSKDDERGSGSLYPDGAYSEALACPAYDAENNFIDGITHEKLFGTKRFRGTITFWMKPNYSVRSTKPRVLVSLNKPVDMEKDPALGYRVGQDVFGLFLLPQAYPENRWDRFRFSALAGPDSLRLLWFWNPGRGRGNIPPEYLFMNTIREGLPPSQSGIYHQWLHIGLAWDTNPISKRWSYDCPNCQGRGTVKLKESEILCSRCQGQGKIVDFKITASDVYAFCINGQDVSRYISCEQEKYPPQIVQYSALAKNNLIRLGERTTFPFWNASADATIDEFTIQLHDSIRSAKNFIITEYKRGRYYKGGGVFTSGTIDVPTLSEAAVIKEKPPNHKAKASIKARAVWNVYYPAGWDTVRHRVEVQFFDEKGNISRILDSPAGSDFKIPIRKPGTPTRIKYKVFFRGDQSDLTTPFLETPIFDDITVTFICPEAKPCEWYVMP